VISPLPLRSFRLPDLGGLTCPWGGPLRFEFEEMERKPSGVVTLLAFCAAILLVSTFANAVPAQSPFLQCDNFPLFPELGRNATRTSTPFPRCKNFSYIPDLKDPHQPCMPITKIGRIIEGHNLIWGESVGWVNLGARNADIKIGSNILAGWIWIENCGWVCIGEGHPLNGERYSNRGSSDWGVNNDGKGNVSGYAWSEVTGWINFSTSHSRVYLDENGQFYGYAWGENVGWMHFGPGRTVQYLAKADPGPWREIGPEPGGRLAGSQNNSEMSSGSGLVPGLRNNYERYEEYAFTVCLLRIGRDDSCARIRCCDTLVCISNLAKLAPIRAPPVIA